MDLFGMRLVVAIESEENRKLNETQVKELTGGDPIRGRRMREDNWEFRPSHTLIMATNHKPKIRGTDHGIWRRLKLVPFNVTVDDGQADKEMPEKLRGELPGILRWCVDGCLDWKELRLDEPAEVVTATEGYRDSENVFGGFWDDWIKLEFGAKLRAKDLHAAYAHWAREENQPPMSSRQISLYLEERGISKTRNNGIVYLGIGLQRDVPPPPGQQYSSKDPF
jgi:putative DNA primase/helicase